MISRGVDRLVDPGRNLPPGAPEPRFTDVTKAAGLASFRQFQGARTSQLPEDMGSGVAWGDFDNDGLDDLFVVSGGGPLGVPASQLAPSVLYRNLGDGRFEKVEDFPDLRIHGMGAAWGDYNNDGWLDLVVTGYDTIVLFRNDHGHLVRDKSFPSPKGFWAGASWGDYNRDGYLDLYVCGYVKYKPGERDASANSTQFGLEVPFTLNPASYEPERNLLFRNNGNGTFTRAELRQGRATAYRARCGHQDRVLGSALAARAGGDLDKSGGESDLGHHAGRAGREACSARRSPSTRTTKIRTIILRIVWPH